MSIASGRTDCRLIEARLDCDNGERARGSRLIGRVSDRFHLLDIGDGIRQVAIDFAEVLFLTASQHLFAAREREDQNSRQVDCGNHQHGDCDNLCQTELSHRQRVDERETYHDQHKPRSEKCHCAQRRCKITVRVH